MKKVSLREKKPQVYLSQTIFKKSFIFVFKKKVFYFSKVYLSRLRLTFQTHPLNCTPYMVSNPLENKTIFVLYFLYLAYIWYI